MTARRPRSGRLAAAATATASLPSTAASLPSTAASPPSTERWQSYLATELCCPVRVVYTRARKKPLQVRPVPAGPERAPRRTSSLEVRMHSFFAAAPPEIQRAVASWIRSGRRAPRACALLDRWILESLEKLPAPDVCEHELHARGDCYDLAGLAGDLCANELAHDFASPADLPRLTWGRQGPSRTRHSIRLGSYDQEGSVVRIHPALDQPGVPEYFVRYVLFHELLHALHPPREGQGARWIHHGREFRKRERAYPDYARAIAWEIAHIKAVIRSARRGTPLRIGIAAEQPGARPACAGWPARSAPARGPERLGATAKPAAVDGSLRAQVRRVLQGWLFPAD